MPDFPRLLIVTQYPFSRRDAGGISLGMLFGGWSADRLAQAYGPSPVIPSWDACQRFYRLGGAEIMRAWPLSMTGRHCGGRLKASTGQEDSRHHRTEASPNDESLKRRLIRIAERLHLQHQTRAVITPELTGFIQDFAPEAMFATLGSLAHIRLVRQIHERYGVPLAIQVNDDWMSDIYPGGLLRLTLGKRLDREFRELVRLSALRFCICDEMAEMLRQRYGCPFQSMPIPVDVEEWQRQTPVDHAPRDSEHLIVYCGSLFANAQIGTLRLVSRALDQLHAEGIRVDMRIETTAEDAARHAAGLCSRHVTVSSGAGRLEQIRMLQEANALLIPVNFDADSLRFIQYSLPGKTSAYLATGTPLLVVGPAHVPPAAYAKREGVAEVVTTPDISAIADGIRRVLLDHAHRKTISARAMALARQRHDRHQVAESLRCQLSAIAFNPLSANA